MATFFLLLEEEVIPLQAKAQSESSIAYQGVAFHPDCLIIFHYPRTKPPMPVHPHILFGQLSIMFRHFLPHDYNCHMPIQWHFQQASLNPVPDKDK